MKKSLKELLAPLGRFFGSHPKPGGTDADYIFSKELEHAAMMGDPVAQTKLATAYHEGLGVKQNPQRAFNFWMAAASQGHGGAQSMIAAAYDVGKVVAQNKVEAAYWATLSTRNGNVLGEALLGTLLSEMSEEDKSRLLLLFDERHSSPGTTDARTRIE